MVDVGTEATDGFRFIDHDSDDLDFLEYTDGC